MDTWIVTGGAGFIGSNFVEYVLRHRDARVVVFDKLTYAGNLLSLAGAARDPRFAFVQGDIADRDAVRALLHEQRPSAILNFAAESHVDRSIDTPGEFVETNIVGTFTLLEGARALLADSTPAERERFRFLHVSTDEVYGSLGAEGSFHEETPYAPNSPYAASKAAADHLVRAYVHTYGLPALVTNCSNNYGPYQFPEKLIPLMILNALEGKPLPIYGDGRNVRDWIYVEDHCAGVLRGARTRQAGREVQPGRRQRAHQPGDRRRHLRIGRARPAGGAEPRPRGARPARLPPAQEFRRRPAGPRPPLRHRRPQGAARAGLEPAARHRKRPRLDRRLVPRELRVVRGGAVGPLPPRAAGTRRGMRVEPTALSGVLLVEPDVHRDERGFFLETYHAAKYAAAGISAIFVQDNHSRSQGPILRGLHAQLMRPQGKLVRAIEGSIFDVAVDIRRGSPTFARWVGYELSAENFRQLWVPAGFAHGFCVLAGPVQVEYKCTALYDPADELAIAWNDPEIGIDWPIAAPLLSAKDAAAPRLAQVLDRLPLAAPGS